MKQNWAHAGTALTKASSQVCLSMSFRDGTGLAEWGGGKGARTGLAEGGASAWVRGTGRKATGRGARRRRNARALKTPVP